MSIAHKKNLLFLMVDQMQASVLRPDSSCRTPNFDKLLRRGVRFERAYTPNAVCSPARASLMTGLLPHNHGVMEVTHVVEEDQCQLRREFPHWAQRLQAAGYRTGYFGKWHVERSENPSAFGWEVNGVDLFGKHVFGLDNCSLWEAYAEKVGAGDNHHYEIGPPSFPNQEPPGYREEAFYGVTEKPTHLRPMGLAKGLAMEFLQEQAARPEPWCCFVSLPEPHDPFYAGREALESYDIDAIPLPPNANDPLKDRPNLYRKAGRVWRGMTDRQKREAAACYYASITEIDEQFGRLLDFLDESGQTEDTVVVLTTDHGELLGSHGLYCKNFSAFEEIYNIPLVIAGPGVAKGVVSQGRVGLHDLCPTLLELLVGGSFDYADSRSFKDLLENPLEREKAYDFGYAEYHGGRYRLTQRVVWDGPWKFVHNGFDEDELYNLEEDPHELVNRIEDTNCVEVIQRLTLGMWRVVKATGDKALLDTHYPIMRIAPYGPLQV
jgi:arylsulfatase A-like enzyme